MRYKVWTDFFPMCGRCHRNNNEMLNKNLLICPDTSSRFKKKKKNSDKNNIIAACFGICIPVL